MRYPVSTTVGVILVVLFGSIALFRIPIQLVNLPSSMRLKSGGIRCGWHIRTSLYLLSTDLEERGASQCGAC